MKTEINAQYTTENNNNMKKNQESAPRLSDDAFYLIALTMLLKKETGSASLEQYLTPAGLPFYNGKTAA